MDKKISEFAIASTATATTIIPIVADGANKRITFGVLALNLPNFGNKGITKNAVIDATLGDIPLTHTIVTLTTVGENYSLPDGTDGQEITLLSNNSVTVNPNSSYVLSISMSAGSSVTLIFIDSMSKWFIKSQYKCTMTNFELS